MSEILDLDILRPKKRSIKIGGKEVDVSFVPCAITFDLDAAVRELQDSTKKVDLKKSFEVAVKICALFCANQYPEMTEKWLMDHTDAKQLNVFALEIQKTLAEAYAGVEEYSKNLGAAQEGILT